MKQSCPDAEMICTEGVPLWRFWLWSTSLKSRLGQTRKNGKVGGGCAHKFKIKFLLQFPGSTLPVVNIWQAINLCSFILLKNLKVREIALLEPGVSEEPEVRALCCHLLSTREPADHIALAAFTRLSTKACSSLSF